MMKMKKIPTDDQDLTLLTYYHCSLREEPTNNPGTILLESPSRERGHKENKHIEKSDHVIESNAEYRSSSSALSVELVDGLLVSREDGLSVELLRRRYQSLAVKVLGLASPFEENKKKRP